MATSDGYGRRLLRYLESTRNLVGCGGGAIGLGLHFAGLGGSWWPGVVAGLYGAGALLTPDPPPEPEPEPKPGTRTGTGAGTGAPGQPEQPKPEPEPKPEPAPKRPDPDLAALAAYLGTVPLPASAGVDALLAALREAGPGPAAEAIVRHRLPVAVDGYLRARTWLPWAGPDAPDPAAELGREVKQLSAELD
ncbi:hypothetical protein [Streptomyces sp. CBMA123]|uniref:hypothetical protein n=1 Tax=Streptomyces sp. CBMA123 TaxID=1896313 RepID=UPI001661B945|nr:hypothetical protein [Streptomyces sp. CBMA123]MBD0694901.1 hypothetical protein [Streptomyces sp. CBMA123]